MNRTTSDEQVEAILNILVALHNKLEDEDIFYYKDDDYKAVIKILDFLAPAQSDMESEVIKKVVHKMYEALQAIQTTGLNTGCRCSECMAIKHFIDGAILECESFLSRAPVEKAKVCEWVQEEFESEHWSGECGIEWITFEDTPKNNGMNFCPKCGRPLKQIEKELDEDDDDESPGGNMESGDISGTAFNVVDKSYGGGS